MKHPNKKRKSKDEVIIREHFKEGGLFKSIRRGVTNIVKKASSAFNSIGDAIKAIDLEKEIKKPLRFVNNFFEDAKKFTQKIEGEIKNKSDVVRKELEKSVKKLEEIVEKDLKKGFKHTKGIADVIKEFDKMIKFTKSVGPRVENVFFGVGNVFYGIGLTLEGIGKGIGLGFLEIGELLTYLGEFLFTYLICIVKFTTNLWSCFFYYIVELFIQIIYLPIRIMLFLGYAMGLDLYARERQVFEGLYDLSYMAYSLTGYHFMFWPKHIRERCFVCVRLKTDAVAGKASDVDKAFNEKLPEFMQRGIGTIQKGQRHFKEVGAMPSSRPATRVK